MAPAPAVHPASRAIQARPATPSNLLRQEIEGANGPFVSVQGRWVLNFAGTNYLGLGRHPLLAAAMMGALERYGLSLSMPRILATEAATPQLELGLAELAGQEQALLFPSTTHAMLDLIPFLAGPASLLLLDAWSYPISREAARLAHEKGAKVGVFGHNDVAALRSLLTQYAAVANKVIVCDGVYSSGGGQARLREFAQLAYEHGATVLVDDAHGLGVLGRRPSDFSPYGYGGGGILLHQAARANRVIYVGSLSKAFSVPVAFAAGPKEIMTKLSQVAGTFVHSSPSAIPVVAAAAMALRLNAFCGDKLRAQLLARVRYFRRAMAHQGLTLFPATDFPIQSLRIAKPAVTQAAADMLRRHGIWVVTHDGPADYPSGCVLRLIVTRLHTEPVLAGAAARIARVIQRLGAMEE